MTKPLACITNAMKLNISCLQRKQFMRSEDLEEAERRHCGDEHKSAGAWIMGQGRGLSVWGCGGLGWRIELGLQAALLRVRGLGIVF